MDIRKNSLDSSGSGRGDSRRILICSLGSIGKKYLRLLRTNWPRIELGVLRYKHTSSDESGVEATWFKDEEDALKWKPSHVIIASPASRHARQALKFSDGADAILIEKPIGTGVDDCTELEELANSIKQDKMYVGYVLRQDPCARRLRGLLHDGSLGKIVYCHIYCGSWLPNWRQSLDYRQDVSAVRRLGGGVLLELSHEIDLAVWLFGEIESVGAVSRNTGCLDIDVEDNAVMLFKTADGSPLVVSLDFCTSPPKREILVRGTFGEAKWDLTSSMLNIVDESGYVECMNGMEVDERFMYQLRGFLDESEDAKANLGTLKEGMNVLETIKKIRVMGGCK